MRSFRHAAFLLFLVPAIAGAKDIYLHIAGSVGVFRTDTRIINSSATNDISITATFLPVGGGAQIVRTINVPKRQMVVYDDVVSTLFQGSGLGAIKLSSSAEDFVATSRIYAQTSSGTLGQFVVGLDPSAAKTRGVLIQLKANGGPGQAGTFRTNTGFVNPNTTEASVTIRQFDRTSAQIGQPITITVPPMGVIFPVGGVLAASEGFTDAWLSFESSQPVFGFGSVVDNLTTDPTFIPAFEDVIGGATEVYLSIAGSVGVFRTDTRIFNPSDTKDITIIATFMPRVGEANMTRVERPITVPKRQMLIFDDVVSSVFQASGLGAIRLISADSFLATSRIYAQASGGTLGQFVAGQQASAAKQKGLLTQLKSNTAFRVNTGFVNPNGTDASVTIWQYDKNNAMVGEPLNVTVPAMGVLFPVSTVLVATAANFSDAWLGYESNLALFGFASVVDNGTTDPTFVPAFEDKGSNPAPPPQPSAKIFDITASTSGNTSRFTVQPGGSNEFRVAIGDTVTLRVRSADVLHGFILDRYAPNDTHLNPGQVREFTFVADQQGCFNFVCTVTTCSAGHSQMVGQMIVGTASCRDPYEPPY